jgi:hypothetical protein
MASGKWSPPGFTSEDTSNEAARRIPFFSLGDPLLETTDETMRSVSFRPEDISGAHISRRFPSQTLIVVATPNQINIPPSKMRKAEKLKRP